MKQNLLLHSLNIVFAIRRTSEKGYDGTVRQLINFEFRQGRWSFILTDFCVQVPNCSPCVGKTSRFTTKFANSNPQLNLPSRIINHRKQTQTTKERKRNDLVFYFTYNGVCVILSLWLQINLNRKVEQSEQYICKHKSIAWFYFSTHQERNFPGNSGASQDDKSQ